MKAGVKLAQDFRRIETEIKLLAEHGPLNFEVREEGGKGIIVVSQCDCGSCSKDELVFDSYDKARLEAAKMTFHGQEPDNKCPPRLYDEDKWTCQSCGREKWPVWDEAPGLAQFCPFCDKYAD
ncbi:hypothetical protein N0B30_23760 [Bacillus subtilis]|mgnify:FL=1|uniref:hypothetical protein n=1 Tax=Bacillus TaxID=1386 RepID=UPI00080C76DF|nr:MULTISPECIES: hypothetical protein [Bacillus subtilis group]MCT6515641.1 hypothetical protein [Bacillus subtilis]OCB98137.1 hypothetical protein SRCM101294_00791 [Bacillus amyloliquefaciens]QEO08540.1 hypothetical protein FLQ07_23485 [Bacillus paralicheniformis]HEO2443874.1 hypothetical protein [Streptococcus agalactiae]